MKVIRVLAVVAAVAVAAVAAAASGEADFDETDVVVLTDDNFADFINNDLALVEFYAPWCGHCKRLAPEYAQAATALKDEGIVLGKLDATEFRSYSDRYGVTGFPTLKVFRNGGVADYKGGRTKDTIVSYMQRQVGPSAKPVSDAAAVEALVGDAGLDPVLLFLSDGADAQARDQFINLANRMRDDPLRFAESTTAALRAAYAPSVGGNAVVVAIRAKAALAGDEASTVTHAFPTSNKALEDFAKFGAFPAATILTSDNRAFLADGSFDIAYVVVNVDMEENAAEFQAAFEAASAGARKAHSDEHPVRVGVTSLATGKAEASLFGFGDDGPAVGAGIVDADGTKFLMAGDWSADGFAAFLSKFVSNDLDAFVKSEPVPARAVVSGLTTLVGTTFEDVVFQREKDVLVEVYAPWCGHCKKLAPTWESLAETYKRKSSVVIAKVDGEANDLPSTYKGRGYPSIFFAPANSDKTYPLRYDGDRDHDSFVAYINENARNPASVLTKGGKGGSKKRRGGKKGKKKGRKGKDEL